MTQLVNQIVSIYFLGSWQNVSGLVKVNRIVVEHFELVKGHC